jgi:sec-independent protein translocase protein TatA
VGALEPMHLLIILFIVLLLFGAKRLPGLARSLGTSARELKKGLNEDAPPDEPAQASQAVLQASATQSSTEAEASGQASATPPES